MKGWTEMKGWGRIERRDGEEENGQGKMERLIIVGVDQKKYNQMKGWSEMEGRRRGEGKRKVIDE